MTPVFSVTSLTESIKHKLENGFSSVRVQGEVSNLKEQSSGHLYFTLKDQQAQISAVLFRTYAQNLSRPLKNGDQLIIQGEISVYAPRGAYQLLARNVEFLGVGELLMKLHALKELLASRGWFAKERKKSIPLFPKTIGVVTSPTGAVIQDILHVLTRRLEKFHLVLYPVKVQGEGAAEEIATAIHECNKHQLADVLIVGRGGGSLEDLFAFNEECVASAIYHSKIPIISAVGHETDFSLADFVADLRAPTPSAAAEIVSAERGKQLLFLEQAKVRLKTSLLRELSHWKQRLEKCKRHPLITRPLSLLEPHFQKLDDLSNSIDGKITARLQDKKLHLLALTRQASALSPQKQIVRCREKLQALSSHLQGIDPKNLLKKGYCILFEEKSPSVIVSTKQMHKDQKLRLKVSDGEALVNLYEIHHD